MNLEDKIREALPQLNKLTKGCLIKESDSIKEVILRYKWDFIDTYSKERIIETFNIRKPTFETIGHPVKVNDVIEYINVKSKFKELFYYYCSAEPSENNESTDSFESNLKDYKTIFTDIYYDEEEGYHPDYDRDILYKAIVNTQIYEVEDGYKHMFIIEPKEFILRNWNFSSVFLADQNEKLKDFLNNL